MVRNSTGHCLLLLSQALLLTLTSWLEALPGSSKPVDDKYLHYFGCLALCSCHSAQKPKSSVVGHMVFSSKTAKIQKSHYTCAAILIHILLGQDQSGQPHELTQVTKVAIHLVLVGEIQILLCWTKVAIQLSHQIRKVLGFHRSTPDLGALAAMLPPPLVALSSMYNIRQHHQILHHLSLFFDQDYCI